MVARGRSFIGTAYTNRNDGQETNVIRSEFGSITPENAMKWNALQPNQGQFQWGGADQVANWAQQNGKQLRCHALVVGARQPRSDNRR
jgi:endo-1,4-beta-xylanase